MAVQAALTGHLVFSTLHTNDAPSAVSRLMELGVPPYLINATLLGVLAQRLVDRKSTRLNSSHLVISYAVFCLKKKKKNINLGHDWLWLVYPPSSTSQVSVIMYCS